MTYYMKGRRTARFQHFTLLHVREREGKTIYFNITKLLRPGNNIANGVQNPFKSIKFAILSCSSLSLRIRLNFLNDERRKEKDR